ncbi:MAG: serine/threonine-protein kinase [Pirellulales bacterium]
MTLPPNRDEPDFEYSRAELAASDAAFPVESEREPRFDELDYLLLAYDGLLAEGGKDTVPPSAALPPAVVDQLSGAEQCLRVLEQIWPRARRTAAARATTRAPEDSEYRRLGNYELLDEIARGGMGVVYRARQIGLNRIVALKLILAGRFASKDEERRFRNEAEAAARLRHPGIVPIYEIGEQDGQPFFSMAFVDGVSLDARLQQGPLPMTEAARLTQLVAEAVAHAHSQGIVHRDLKPHNILLEGANEPKITDFGLAKRLDLPEGLTATGAILGTPSYMSPEQAAGRTAEVGPLSDVYSLGAILYTSLTGHPPFRAASLTDTLRQVVEQEVVPPSLANPAIPRDLETICLKCLRKHPADRYASASQLAEDLARFQRGEPITARPVSSIERMVHWTRRRPVAAALVVMSAVTALLLVVGWEYRERSEQWRRTAEARAELAAEKTTVANQQTQLAAQQSELARRNLAVANLATAMRHFSRASELASRRLPGWSWEALQELRKAEQLAEGKLDDLRLRSLAAECLAAADLRPVGVVAEQIHPKAVAFSPDSRFVAVAQHKGIPDSSIFVYDVATQQLIEKYSLDTLAANAQTFVGNLFKGGSASMYQDGMFAVAFSPDSRWIAAGTRRGRVCVWDRLGCVAPTFLGGFKDDYVRRVVFDADSRTLYAGAMAYFHIGRWAWKNERWEPLDNLFGSRDAFAVHHDGSRLFSGTGRFRVLDLSTGKSREDLPETPAGNVAYVPESDSIVLSESRALRSLDALTGRTARIFRAPVEEVATEYLGTARFAARSGLMFQGTDSEVVRVIDLATDRPTMSLDTKGHMESPIATSPDGRWLALGEANATRLYEIRPADIRSVALQSLDPINDFALSADGRSATHLAAHFQPIPQLPTPLLRGAKVITTQLGSDSNSSMSTRRAVNWQAEGGHFFSRFSPRAARDVGKVAVSPTAEHLAVACELTGLHWRGPQGIPVWPERISADGFQTQVIEELTLTSSDAESSVKLIDDPTAYDGKAVEYYCMGDNSVWRLRVPLVRPVQAGQTISVIVRLRATARRLELPSVHIAIEGRETLKVEPLPSGEYTWLHAGLIAAESATDSVNLVVVSDMDRSQSLALDRVVVLPFEQDRERDWQAYPYYGSIAFAPNGRALFAILHGDRLAAWDVSSGRLLHIFENNVLTALTGVSPFRSVAVGQRQVLAGNESGGVLRWEWETAKPLDPLAGPGSGVSALALTPDETLVAIGANNGQIRVVQLESLNTVVELSGHDQQVVALAFEPSGSRLWSGSLDGSIRRWDQQSGVWRSTLVLTEGATPIKALRLAPSTNSLFVLREGESVVHQWHLRRLPEPSVELAD